jgi:1-acyl-sn-glycerol-3-phosphate acyltransferase
VRGLLAVPLLALLTILFGLPAIACAAIGARRAARGVTRAWARTLLGVVGVKVVVEGLRHVPAGAAVYVANHGSVLDFPVLFGHLPVDFLIIHKRSLHLVPVVGLYLYAAGHIAIDRVSGFRARRALERAAERIRGGSSVLVFPEGTRSVHGEVGPFKKGSFLVAVRAGAPVVPISLAGVKGVMPAGLRGMRTGTVHLIVHPPVATAGRGLDEARALAERVRSIVVSGCAA